jgi:antitoxin component YwqK of YwqJK toxin-antitoxin module
MYKVIFENKIITRSQFFDKDDGYLKQEMHFNEDGQLDGTCTEWFDDEKVKQVEVYLKGKR